MAEDPASFTMLLAMSPPVQDSAVAGWSHICTGACVIDSNHTIHDFGQEVHGKVSLADAFRLSCNPAFVTLAGELGDAKLRAAAESFGFNENFLFDELVVYNSIYPTDNRTLYEVAASGIGQSAIVATPMHICLISAAIANGGNMPEPLLIREVRTPAGMAEPPL